MNKKFVMTETIALFSHELFFFIGVDFHALEYET